LNRVDVSTGDLSDPPRTDRLRDFCLEALAVMGIDDWEVSLLLCGDGDMAQLNRSYRNADGPTDVLAFRQDDGMNNLTAAVPHPAGDIVISLDALRRNAARYGATPEMELRRLVVHGLLHLSGMEHDGHGGEMIERQEQILARLQEKTQTGALFEFVHEDQEDTVS